MKGRFIDCSDHSIVPQRLELTLENLRILAEVLLCVLLAPLVIGAAVVTSINDLFRSGGKAALETLIGIPLFYGFMTFFALGYSVYFLFHDLILGYHD